MASKIVAISAGLGTPSSSRLLAEKLAAAVVQEFSAAGGSTEVEVVELREHAVDIANNMVTGFASPPLAAVIEAVVQADALIAVGPVFTASFSGLFKSFFDVIDNRALDGKPVLLGMTGGSARHSMVLDYAVRPLFGYLRARIMPTAVFAAPDDWGMGTGTPLADRVDRGARELVGELVHSAPLARPDPLESLPFEELLAQIQRS